MNAEQYVKPLNQLVKICTDTAMGLRESAGLAISPGLKTAIQDLEQEWKEIQEALRAEIIYLDGTPELQTTLVGDAKRAYTKVRTALSIK